MLSPIVHLWLHMLHNLQKNGLCVERQVQGEVGGTTRMVTFSGDSSAADEAWYWPAQWSAFYSGLLFIHIAAVGLG